MTCGCNDCAPTGYICVPRGSDQVIVVTVRENDCDGDLFDISGAQEIVFIVADELGGTVRIEKRMSGGEINISTNDYQFYFTVTAAETGSLVRTSNYFEIEITTSEGLIRHVLSGIFKSQDTMIRALD